MAGIEIGQYALDGSIAGAGPPLLFLHGGDYVAQNGPFLDRLARHWQVTAPRHPGFGHSERPDGFRTVDDLAYLYLDWLDRQPDDGAVVVGSSFGGWMALEICVRSVAKISGAGADRLARASNSAGAKSATSPISTPCPRTSCAGGPFSIRRGCCPITPRSATTN